MVINESRSGAALGVPVGKSQAPAMARREFSGLL